ncbi:MOSC domain-containing protein [Aquipuribacter hungaricus]|uniref:MOSC domain-containing protein n=1 Tax=Aquipuribacter hungaricus TaxID=545624 RepID=A0ABV7WGR3_9MICO
MPSREPVAAVASLHRYPVKSLLGEQVDRLEVDARGCAGDRVWALSTGGGMLASGKSGRRFTAVPGLQQVRARLVGGTVLLRLPDGTETSADDPAAPALLSAHLGREVTLLREADGSSDGLHDGVGHFDDGPVSLLGTASVGAVADDLGAPVPTSRFRPNIVLRTDAAWAEDAWDGRRLQVGDVLLDVVQTSPRCTMVDAATADTPAQPGVLKAVGRLNGAELGIIADVVRGGVVAVGDQVSLVGDGPALR